MEIREPAVAYGKEKISIAAYLELENASPEKHEYYKGEIFAISGNLMITAIHESLLVSDIYEGVQMKD